LANGGTLFLDEIGEMPLEMQVRLLRAIQEQQIQRVGGQRQIKLDVRIIAATNRDLLQEVKKNRFRKDLYYRLNVLPLELPPLRAREKDVALLADFFIKKKAMKQNQSPLTFSNDQLELMCRYDWPGNVRELENFIEQYINLGEKVFASHFVDVNTRGESAHAPKIVGGDVPDLSLREMELNYIRSLLQKHAGNKTKVARILGISRNTLYQKLSG
jgi:transcriptional regulator with PAS, ATPase and Fis domain